MNLGKLLTPTPEDKSAVRPGRDDQLAIGRSLAQIANRFGKPKHTCTGFPALVLLTLPGRGREPELPGPINSR